MDLILAISLIAGAFVVGAVIFAVIFRAVGYNARKRIAEAEEAARIQKQLDEVKSEIINFFTENKTDMDKIKPVLELCRSHGYGNPNEIDNLDVAKEVLSACK